MINFAIVGGGWRSEFFLRVAQALPERFGVCAMVVRNEEKGKRVEEKWSVPTFRTVESLLRSKKPSFVVASVPRAVAPEICLDLARRGVYVLCETPPAKDLPGLLDLNKNREEAPRIQIAEQYHLQPLHAARLAIAGSGKLGEVSEAQISVCHWYHAISLIRRFLGVTYENAKITTYGFDSPITDGPDRFGPPKEERIVTSNQVFAFFDFDGKLGVYDFVYDQYFSWIRSQRLLVRGTMGEIRDGEVRYLLSYNRPITLELAREQAGEYGNLEGYYLKGILAGNEWVYVNPFIPGRLSDDEIAVASCLEKMEAYTKGGPPLYSLAEASQDHYLALLVDECVRNGKTVTTQTQPWAEQ